LRPVGGGHGRAVFVHAHDFVVVVRFWEHHDDSRAIARRGDIFFKIALHVIIVCLR
jgi:hypothetical protein